MVISQEAGGLAVYALSCGRVTHCVEFSEEEMSMHTALLVAVEGVPQARTDYHVAFYSGVCVLGSRVRRELHCKWIWYGRWCRFVRKNTECRKKTLSKHTALLLAMGRDREVWTDVFIFVWGTCVVNSLVADGLAVCG